MGWKAVRVMAVVREGIRVRAAKMEEEVILGMRIWGKNAGVVSGCWETSLMLGKAP